jgi:hypothetical protein
MKINMKTPFHVLLNEFESSTMFKVLMCTTIMPHMNNLFKDVKTQAIIFN